MEFTQEDQGIIAEITKDFYEIASDEAVMHVLQALFNTFETLYINVHKSGCDDMASEIKEKAIKFIEKLSPEFFEEKNTY